MTMIVNGKEYPLWSQFVERKEEWIGGTLQDFGDTMDIAMGYNGGVTEITDITLEPNGKDSTFFSVHGKDFGCGFDVEVGGVTGMDELAHFDTGLWLTFRGYGGHKWRIKRKGE